MKTALRNANNNTDVSGAQITGDTAVKAFDALFTSSADRGKTTSEKTQIMKNL